MVGFNQLPIETGRQLECGEEAIRIETSREMDTV